MTALHYFVLIVLNVDLWLTLAWLWSVGFNHVHTGMVFEQGKMAEIGIGKHHDKWYTKNQDGYFEDWKMGLGI